MTSPPVTTDPTVNNHMSQRERLHERKGHHKMRLLTDLHQIITRLDVVLVWLGVAPCRL